MKVDTSRLKKGTSDIPIECQQLIERLLKCTKYELMDELKKIETWTFGKCELCHWIDVLDIFDAILEKATRNVSYPRTQQINSNHAAGDGRFESGNSTRTESFSSTAVSGTTTETAKKKIHITNELFMNCDINFNRTDKKLLLLVLNFTTLLIEHSFSRHLYNSIEHLTKLLNSIQMDIVLGVLNLLYMFSKRSNFLSRINIDKKNTLLMRLNQIAESWGGKEYGFALAECCKLNGELPETASTFYYEYFNRNGQLTIIEYKNLNDSEVAYKNPAEFTEAICLKYESLGKEQMLHIFTRLRLSLNFDNYSARLQLVQARLQALSVLVYSSSLQENMHTLIYPGFLEELVELLVLKEPHLMEIRAAALRTLTSIIHLDRNPHFPKKPGSRLGQIIDVTGAASYHGFLPTLVRTCINNLTSNSVVNAKEESNKMEIDQNSQSKDQDNTFPLTLATALFSFLYHLASYESGGESLVSCGIMESLLRVINWPGYELDHITFVTRAVRVIDLITNIEMQGFQVNDGLNAFIHRLDLEIRYCKLEQPNEIKPQCNDEVNSMNLVDQPQQSSQGQNLRDFNNQKIHTRDLYPPTEELPQQHDIIDDSAAAKNQSSSETKQQNLQQQKICLPQRAALLKSMLNFLKKAIQDQAFTDSIRHVMEATLPGSLRHIISNAEYYGPSLFLLATDVVTVYVFQEPSLLSSLQDNGLTDVVLQALLKKQVPATREVLGSLPNVFSALCLNTKGLQAFVKYQPFEILYKILLNPVYLHAMRRRRSNEPMGDTASNLGNAMDELMRHQPSLKTGATRAIIKLLQELVELGTNPKFVCYRPNNKLDGHNTIAGNSGATTSAGTSANQSNRNSILELQWQLNAQNNVNSSNIRPTNGNSSDEDDDDEEEASTNSSSMVAAQQQQITGSSHQLQQNSQMFSTVPSTGAETITNCGEIHGGISDIGVSDISQKPNQTPSSSIRNSPLEKLVEREPIPLIDYILNAMKFIDAILSNNSTDDHCREFVQLGGLEPLLKILGLPNLPVTIPTSAQAVASVCKSILNLANEPQVIQVGLYQLWEVVQRLKPIQIHTEKPGESLLLKELKQCHISDSAMTNASQTPLLHSMSAAHGYIVMHVHICRTGQSDIRSILLRKWGKHLSLLTELVKLYTALVWESTFLLAVCTDDDVFKMEFEFGMENLQKLPNEEIAQTTKHSVPINSTRNGMEFDDNAVPAPPNSNPGTVDANENQETEEKKRKEKEEQLRSIKPLLGASSRMGRALAELFGNLVKLCVGSPLRQRRGQNYTQQQQSYTSNDARDIAQVLSHILVDGFTIKKLEPSPKPKLKLTFLICSVGFTGPMLFDEKRYAFHLMLHHFVKEGGLEQFFKMFEWALTSGRTMKMKDALKKQKFPEGTGEFLDAWLMLLEKMVNPKAILESPHITNFRTAGPQSSRFSQKKDDFDPIIYLVTIHKLAFDAVQKIWGMKPLQFYGARMTESMLSILKHIIKNEEMIREKYLSRVEELEDVDEDLQMCRSNFDETRRILPHIEDMEPTSTNNNNLIEIDNNIEIEQVPSNRTNSNNIRAAASSALDSVLAAAADDAQERVNSTARDSNLNQQNFRYLRDMGFSEECCREALQCCNTIEEATEFLICNYTWTEERGQQPVRDPEQGTSRIEQEPRVETENENNIQAPQLATPQSDVEETENKENPVENVQDLNHVPQDQPNLNSNTTPNENIFNSEHVQKSAPNHETANSTKSLASSDSSDSQKYRIARDKDFMVEKINKFCDSSIDKTLYLMDELPDTVAKGTDLLVVLHRRNSFAWKKMFLNKIIKELNAWIDFIRKNLRSPDRVIRNAMLTGEGGKKFFVRLHLTCLLLEDMYPDIKESICRTINECNTLSYIIALLIETQQLIENMKIEKEQIDYNFQSYDGKASTSNTGKINDKPEAKTEQDTENELGKSETVKWFPQMIIFMDLVEKVNLNLQRKKNMLHITTRKWKWYDISLGRWNVYSTANNKIINEAYNKGESSVRISCGRQRYTINFNAMSQVNEETCNHRCVNLGLKAIDGHLDAEPTPQSTVNTPSTNCIHPTSSHLSSTSYPGTITTRILNQVDNARSTSAAAPENLNQAHPIGHAHQNSSLFLKLNDSDESSRDSASSPNSTDEDKGSKTKKLQIQMPFIIGLNADSTPMLPGRSKIYQRIPAASKEAEVEDVSMEMTPEEKSKKPYSRIKYEAIKIDTQPVGLFVYDTAEIVECCVKLMSPSLKIGRDSFHAIMKLLVRLTRNFKNAKVFAEKGGIKLLLNMRQSCEYMGLVTFAILLIRHVLEEPFTLSLSMEKVLQQRTMMTVPPGYRDLIFLFRQMSSAINRDPKIFKDVAEKILQIDIIGVLRRSGQDDTRIIVKSLPKQQQAHNKLINQNKIVEPIALECAKDLLMALVKPCIHYPGQNQPAEKSEANFNQMRFEEDKCENFHTHRANLFNMQGCSEGANAPQTPANTSDMRNIPNIISNDNGSGDYSQINRQLRSSKSNLSPSTANLDGDQCCDWHMPSQTHDHDKPLLSRATIMKFLSDAIRSYQTFAPILIEHYYIPEDSKLIDHRQSFLEFILDKFLPSKASPLAKSLIAALASCSDQQQVQNACVTEVKLAIKRALLKPESREKHLHLQMLTGLIPTMIENCPPENQALLKLNNLQPRRNEIFYIMLKNGLVNDLAKLIQYLDLSSPHTIGTINLTLKPLEALLRMTNAPGPITISASKMKNDSEGDLEVLNTLNSLRNYGNTQTNRTTQSNPEQSDNVAHESNENRLNDEMEAIPSCQVESFHNNSTNEGTGEVQDQSNQEIQRSAEDEDTEEYEGYEDEDDDESDDGDNIVPLGINLQNHQSSRSRTQIRHLNDNGQPVVEIQHINPNVRVGRLDPSRPELARLMNQILETVAIRQPREQTSREDRDSALHVREFFGETSSTSESDSNGNDSEHDLDDEDENEENDVRSEGDESTRQYIEVFDHVFDHGRDLSPTIPELERDTGDILMIRYPSNNHNSNNNQAQNRTGSSVQISSGHNPRSESSNDELMPSLEIPISDQNVDARQNAVTATVASDILTPTPVRNTINSELQDSSNYIANLDNQNLVRSSTQGQENNPTSVLQRLDSCRMPQLEPIRIVSMSRFPSHVPEEEIFRNRPAGPSPICLPASIETAARIRARPRPGNHESHDDAAEDEDLDDDEQEDEVDEDDDVEDDEDENEDEYEEEDEANAAAYERLNQVYVSDLLSHSHIPLELDVAGTEDSGSAHNNHPRATRRRIRRPIQFAFRIDDAHNECEESTSNSQRRRRFQIINDTDHTPVILQQLLGPTSGNCSTAGQSSAQITLSRDPMTNTITSTSTSQDLPLDRPNENQLLDRARRFTAASTGGRISVQTASNSVGNLLQFNIPNLDNPQYSGRNQGNTNSTASNMFRDATRVVLMDNSPNLFENIPIFSSNDGEGSIDFVDQANYLFGRTNTNQINSSAVTSHFHTSPSSLHWWLEESKNLGLESQSDIALCVAHELIPKLEKQKEIEIEKFRSKKKTKKCTKTSGSTEKPVAATTLSSEINMQNSTNQFSGRELPEQSNQQQQVQNLSNNQRNQEILDQAVNSASVEPSSSNLESITQYAPQAPNLSAFAESAEPYNDQLLGINNSVEGSSHELESTTLNQNANSTNLQNSEVHTPPLSLNFDLPVFSEQSTSSQTHIRGPPMNIESTCASLADQQNSNIGYEEIRNLAGIDNGNSENIQNEFKTEIQQQTENINTNQNFDTEEIHNENTVQILETNTPQNGVNESLVAAVVDFENSAGLNSENLVAQNSNLNLSNNSNDLIDDLDVLLEIIDNQNDRTITSNPIPQTSNQSTAIEPIIPQALKQINEEVGAAGGLENEIEESADITADTTSTATVTSADPSTVEVPVPGPSNPGPVAPIPPIAYEMTPEIRAQLGDLVIPPGVDPTYIAALPKEMRQSVIDEYLEHQQLLRQRNQQNSIVQQRNAVAGLTTDFLGALAPAVQLEILVEQQQHAAAITNPNDPVDAAAFFQSLNPSLRQAILSDMEDSQISVLPPDLAAEAQNLRRDWENRNRQIMQERLMNQVGGNSPQNANSTENNSTAAMRYLYRSPRFPTTHNLSVRTLWSTNSNWGLRSNSPHSHHGNSTASNNNFTSNLSGHLNNVTALDQLQPSLMVIMEKQGRPLLDQEALASLLVSIFIDDPKFNNLRLHRTIRNICCHLPIREWIIRSLLSIVEQTNLIEDSDLKLVTKQPQWLNLRLDAALGARANVFFVKFDEKLAKETTGCPKPGPSNPGPSRFLLEDYQTKGHSILIHPQAKQIVCKHALDLLITLGKHFPKNFLLYENFTNNSENSENSDNFWNIILKLDCTARYRKIFGPQFEQKYTEYQQHETKKNQNIKQLTAVQLDFMTFVESPFGQLIQILNYELIKKSTQLTDKMLRILSYISVGFRDNQLKQVLETNSNPVDPNRGDTEQTPTNFESSSVNQNSESCNLEVINRNPDANSPNDAANAINLTETKEKLNFDSEANASSAKQDSEKKTGAIRKQKLQQNYLQTNSDDMYKKIEQKLNLMINILIEKSCSEEGLEDATQLLLNISKYSKRIRLIVLRLLVNGAKDLGRLVQTQIMDLILELTDLLQKRGSQHDLNQDEQEVKQSFTASSKGIVQNRFTNEAVVIQAPTRMKRSCELQLQSMIPLICKTSAQSYFLKILKVIIQIRLQMENEFGAVDEATKLATANEIASSDAVTKPLSQILYLENLWETLSDCLLKLEESSDNHAVLVLQNAVEAFFLVHATKDPTQAKKKEEDEENENEYKDDETQDSGTNPFQSSDLAQIDPQTLENLENNNSPQTNLNSTSETLEANSMQSVEQELSITGNQNSEVMETQLEASQQNLPIQLNTNTTSAQSLGFPTQSTSSHPQPTTESINLEHSQQQAETTRSPDQLKFINFAEKHRTVLNQILRQSTTHLSDGPFAVLVDHTRILDFDVKRKYFRTELERLDEGIRREELAVHIKRANVFEDSFKELYRRNAEEWKNRFYIVFEDEEGQDAGGLLREWYVIISREIFNPNYALFTISPCDRVTYMINSASYANHNHLLYFKFVGRVIAKAIYDNKLLDCYFTRSFYKHILGIPVKYTDMESYDFEFYKGLKFMLENTVADVNPDLTFSIDVPEFGVTVVKDLIPNGRNVLVSEEDKSEYVRLVCQMKMTNSIRKQLDAFLAGFYEIIPKRLISIFNEQELELLISGLPNIDIEDLKANTEYHKYPSNAIQIQWFWRALREFDKSDRAKFLQFVTGTSKVPLQGFAYLEGMNGIQRFQIHRDDRAPERLPSAHTCFNQLDLPVYPTYDKLRINLLKAIHYCSEGFGFA